MESCKEKLGLYVCRLTLLNLFFHGKDCTPNPFKEVFQSFPWSMEDEILTAVWVDWSIWIVKKQGNVLQVTKSWIKSFSWNLIIVVNLYCVFCDCHVDQAFYDLKSRVAWPNGKGASTIICTTRPPCFTLWNTQVSLGTLIQVCSMLWMRRQCGLVVGVGTVFVIQRAFKLSQSEFVFDSVQFSWRIFVSFCKCPP